MRPLPILPAARLVTHQFLGGRRLLATAAIGLIPTIIALLARMAANAPGLRDRPAFEPDRAYGVVVATLLGAILVPFLALRWGSGVVTDEIENKTLVYLWTRPSGRARVMIAKWLVAMAWLALGLLPIIALPWLVLHAGASPAAAASGARGSGRALAGATAFNPLDLLTIAWDARALALAALAYGALGFALAGLVRRPLIAGLAYVYSIDVGAAYLPGFLQRLSIRHNVQALLTHLDKGSDSSLPQGANKLLEATGDIEPTTEAEAIITLVAIAVAGLLIGAWLLRRREFLADDPARSQ